jgi:hypothetical protein
MSISGIVQLKRRILYIQVNIEVLKFCHEHFAYTRMLLVPKSEGKRPLGRPKLRWVDNIKMDLGEMRWGGVDWIGHAQDRNRWRALVNSVLNFRLP